MKYRPVRYSGNRYYPVKSSRESSMSTGRSTGMNLNNQNLATLFKSSTPKEALRDGRVHCVSVQKTAILTDSYGNRMVLKEHQTSMNMDKDFQGRIKYHDKKNKFTRER